MAFSGSIKRAQIPKLYELCKTDIKIKWWCVECNYYGKGKNYLVCKKIEL